MHPWVGNTQMSDKLMEFCLHVHTPHTQILPIWISSFQELGICKQTHIHVFQYACLQGNE